jgi:hypothetical protein
MRTRDRETCRPPKTAYHLAREKFRALDRRLSRVAAKRPEPVRQALAIRPAANVPNHQPAITIMAPKPETAATIRAFVREEFAEAQRKKKAIAR